MTRTTQSAATPDASAPEVSTKQELRRSKRHKTNSGQTVGASVAVDNTTDSDYVEEASSGKRKRITESKSQAKTNARGTRSKKNTTPANARAPHVEDVDEETDERAGDAALAGDAASRDATIEAEKVRIKRELAPHDYGLPPQDVLMYDSLGLNHYMKQYRHHWTSPASDVPTTIPEKLYWVLQLFIAMTDMKLLPKGQNGANRMVASQGWENAAGPFITGEGYDTLPVWIRCHEIVDGVIEFYSTGCTLAARDDPSWDTKNNCHHARGAWEMPKVALWNFKTEQLDEEVLTLDSLHLMSFTTRMKLIVHIARGSKLVVRDMLDTSIHLQKSCILAPERRAVSKKINASGNSGRGSGLRKRIATLEEEKAKLLITPETTPEEDVVESVENGADADMDVDATAPEDAHTRVDAQTATNTLSASLTGAAIDAQGVQKVPNMKSDAAPRPPSARVGRSKPKPKMMDTTQVSGTTLPDASEALTHALEEGVVQAGPSLYRDEDTVPALGGLVDHQDSNDYVDHGSADPVALPFDTSIHNNPYPEHFDNHNGLPYANQASGLHSSIQQGIMLMSRPQQNQVDISHSVVQDYGNANFNDAATASFGGSGNTEASSNDIHGDALDEARREFEASMQFYGESPHSGDN